MKSTRDKARSASLYPPDAQLRRQSFNSWPKSPRRRSPRRLPTPACWGISPQRARRASAASAAVPQRRASAPPPQPRSRSGEGDRRAQADLRSQGRRGQGGEAPQARSGPARGLADARRGQRRQRRHGRRLDRRPGGRRARPDWASRSAASCLSGRPDESRVRRAQRPDSSARLARAESSWFQPRRTGEPTAARCRGGESTRGHSVVALLSLREPVSSPRRHRRKSTCRGPMPQSWRCAPLSSSL